MTNERFAVRKPNQVWSICVHDSVAAMRLCTVAKNVAQSTAVEIVLAAISRQIGDLFLVTLRRDDDVAANVHV